MITVNWSDVEVNFLSRLYFDILPCDVACFYCLFVCDRCMMDSDDEVRDRATFYMNVLQQKQKALNAAYIFNGRTSQIQILDLKTFEFITP